MSPVRALAAAIGDLTLLRTAGRDASPAAVVESLAFYPVVGLGLGACAAAAATMTDVPLASAAAGVLVLEALAGFAPRRATARVAGGLVAAAALAAKLAGAAAIPAPARAPALLLAPMLGRWAVVVGCHGGTSREAPGRLARVVGRARFQEFGWASLVTFAVALSLAEATGLLLLLVAALMVLGARAIAHRRLGGMTSDVVLVSGEAVETGVLVILGLLTLVAPWKR
jgi:cobalamin synthase